MIQQIFFDSGMVLTYPKSGQWFYPECYFEFCKNNKLPLMDKILQENFKNAYVFLSSHSKIVDIPTEVAIFTDFYKILFANVPGKDSMELIEKCVYGKVKDCNKYLFYDDVAYEISLLLEKYKLGIISDAWPSLLSVYKSNNLDKIFSPFIISSIEGCTKESIDLFHIAISKSDVKPEHCLFIDDSVNNCIKAKEMGMKPIVLSRDINKKFDNIEFPVINCLCQLREIVE